MANDHEVSFVTALLSHHENGHFNTDAHAHEYYQASLLSAVMQGVYDGTVTIQQILEHGDFGIGTFNALDGEMIIVDGVCYRLDTEGKATVVSGDTLTPYAAAIQFDPSVTFELKDEVGKAEFESGLDAMAEAKNLFYAVRFVGKVKYIKYRSVQRQTRPYIPLTEVVKSQAEFELHEAEGTLFGFRCPDYAAGIGVPGYHLHFLSADLSTGGHVLDYTLSNGQVDIDHTSSLHLELPDSEDFSEADLTAGSSTQDIEKAEGK